MSSTVELVVASAPGTPSSYPLEHDGATYYFCRAVCRQEFARDPAAHLKEARC